MHFFNSFSLGGIGIVGLLPGSWAGASGGILVFSSGKYNKIGQYFQWTNKNQLSFNTHITDQSDHLRQHFHLIYPQFGFR